MLMQKSVPTRLFKWLLGYWNVSLPSLLFSSSALFCKIGEPKMCNSWCLILYRLSWHCSCPAFKYAWCTIFYLKIRWFIAKIRNVHNFLQILISCADIYRLMLIHGSCAWIHDCSVIDRFSFTHWICSKVTAWDRICNKCEVVAGFAMISTWKLYKFGIYYG